MSADYFKELQGLLDQLEVRRYALGDLPDDVMYTLWGRLHLIRDLVEESVVRIDHALDGKELRISLATPRPKTDLSLAEIVREVEAGLASRKRVTRKEKEVVLVENGREYRLRVNHHTNEQPTFVVDAVKEAS